MIRTEHKHQNKQRVQRNDPENVFQKRNRAVQPQQLLPRQLVRPVPLHRYPVVVVAGILVALHVRLLFGDVLGLVGVIVVVRLFDHVFDRQIVVAVVGVGLGRLSAVAFEPIGPAALQNLIP